MTVVVYTVAVQESLIFASADFCEARRQARRDDGSMWPRWFREIDGTYTQILKGAR